MRDILAHPSAVDQDMGVKHAGIPREATAIWNFADVVGQIPAEHTTQRKSIYYQHEKDEVIDGVHKICFTT